MFYISGKYKNGFLMKTVKLITCNDAMKAHILKGALENDGIESILYNENWDIHAMESYQFFNRTSMEAKTGAEFSCTFDGTGIAIVGTAQNAEFTVLVDGHTMYENFFVADCLPRQACLVIDQLPEGKHSMRVFVTSGQFKLDVLEIPEAYPRMTDTLLIPSNVRSAAAAEIRQQSAVRERQREDAFMDADAMLWHLEHPFTEPPKKQDVPAADEDAVSSEVAETSTEVPVPDSDENTSDATDNDVLAETTDDNVTAAEVKLEQTEPASEEQEISVPEETETMAQEAEQLVFDEETSQSMAEIDAIFNAAPETEESHKEADVEMEMTADQIERILNPDGAKKYADDSAESEQI